jgi:hypothetical protein
MEPHGSRSVERAPSPSRGLIEEAGAMAQDKQQASDTDKAAKDKMAKGMAEAGKGEIGKAGKKDIAQTGTPGTDDMIEGMSEAGKNPTAPDEKGTSRSSH